MGAAGSIMLADGEDLRISAPSAFPSLTKATTKTNEVGNSKSKFPSILQSAQIAESQTKDQPVQTFKISLPHDMCRIHNLITSGKYLLRVSPESLDIIDEGISAPLLQFPYQNILSWGSSPVSFQFTVFNHQQNASESVDDSSATEGDDGDDIETSHKRCDSAASSAVSDGASTIELHGSKSDQVEVGNSACVGVETDLLPERLPVGLSNDSQCEEDLISCSSNLKSVVNSSPSLRNIPIEEHSWILKTTQAIHIEAATMTAVRHLMLSMNSSALTKIEFDKLLVDLIDPMDKRLQSNWEEIILRYSNSRAFLARQAMDIILLVGPLAPFEKFDIACLLYKKVLNKESFDLVVGTFENLKDRENLQHLLKLNNQK